MKGTQGDLWHIDAIKAIASQLIVWHHLVAYGPMAETIYPHAEDLIDWLYSHARQAVQAFLVVGGYLAARSFCSARSPSASRIALAGLPRLIWSRYVRLARPYLAAVALAILSAAIARALVDDPDTPASPSLWQILMHALLIHDLADVPALSAGVWYVAIDLQLYALFALSLWMSQRLAAMASIDSGYMTTAACLILTVGSLFWVNRNPALDEWAPYFFGSYGLGIMAYWASRTPSKSAWLAGMVALLVAALWVDWRSRIAIAGATAMVLATAPAFSWSPGKHLKSIAGRLGKMSYSLFLAHYPVGLLLGAVVAWLWPRNPVMNGLGIVLAWLLSLTAASAMYALLEQKKVRA